MFPTTCLQQRMAQNTGVSMEIWPHQVLEADVATEGGAKQLADAITAQFGVVDYAVSAIGGWWQKGVSVCTVSMLPLCHCDDWICRLSGRAGVPSARVVSLPALLRVPQHVCTLRHITDALQLPSQTMQECFSCTYAVPPAQLLRSSFAGALLEQPLSEVIDGVHTYAVSHFVFAKTILPLLRDSPDSAYIIITGAAGKLACRSCVQTCWPVVVRTMQL